MKTKLFKNLFAIFCTVILLFSIAGCGEDSASGNGSCYDEQSSSSYSSWVFPIDNDLPSGMLLTRRFYSFADFSDFYSVFKTKNDVSILTYDLDDYSKLQKEYTFEIYSFVVTSDDMNFLKLPGDTTFLDGCFDTKISGNCGEICEAVTDFDNVFSITISDYAFKHSPITLDNLIIIEDSDNLLSSEKDRYYDIFCDETEIGCFHIFLQKPNDELFKNVIEWAKQQLTVMYQ